MKTKNLAYVIGVVFALGCSGKEYQQATFSTRIDRLDSTHREVMEDFAALPDEEHPAAWKDLTSQIGALVFSHCMRPADIATSDHNLVDFCYAAYMGEVFRIRTAQQREGNDPEIVALAQHRIDRVVSAFPLSSAPNWHEHRLLVMTLARLMQLSASSATIHQRVRKLQVDDQLPLWVVLSEMGDGQAGLKLKDYDAQKVDSLLKTYRSAQRSVANQSGTLSQ